MKIMIKNIHPNFKSIFNMLVDLPSPSSINYMWNWGSLLGMNLIIQLISGIFLSMHYTPSTDMAFSSVIHIIRDVNSGWLMRSIHMNGASLFFILIYAHIARGIMFSSFKSKSVWITGTFIFLILMATAFLGYVLPWGQMSFWGATVITNLVSAIPYLGKMVVIWLWGNFSVSNATLNRFFSLHFLVPFILLVMILFHLMSLHITGSNNPMGVKSNLEKVSFHPFFTLKDSMTMIIIFAMMMFISLISPYLLNDPDNFNPANPLSTPIHIQPEWYFLFAYAILRSIPNKLGGVVGLLASILILLSFPYKKKHSLSSKYNPAKKVLLSLMVMNFLILTWIGGNPVEPPYETLGQTASVSYFIIMINI